jgi:hypothetical protein
LSDGQVIHVVGDRSVEVPEFDAIAYGRLGWERQHHQCAASA